MISISLTLLVLAVSLFPTHVSFAAPDLLPSIGYSIPLIRRQPSWRSVEDIALARKERNALNVKYDGSPLSIRSEGASPLVNQEFDTCYLGSVFIGTPPAPFYVTLDTGSADLWVAETTCYTGCSNMSTYDPSSSSTFQNLSHPFNLAYGSGQVAGNLVSDVVQMAGFEVKNQSFGAVTQISHDFVEAPTSGLMGLGFQNISVSKQMPFWQTLSTKGTWSQPVMAFQFTRFRNDSSGRPVEPGGSFTMGFLNTSLYTGEIDYQNLVGPLGFWVLALSEFTFQGHNLPLPSGSGSYAMIDTGTTTLGGPVSVIQKIFDQIPGSRPGASDWENNWIYPCDTPVNITISFGGRAWPVDPDDFQLTQIGPNECISAFTAIEGKPGDGPQWIIGLTFLKNVYSVFRYDPPSVGFAALSEIALSMNKVDKEVPSVTIGPATVSVTATGDQATSGAIWISGSAVESLVVACGVAIAMGAIMLV